MFPLFSSPSLPSSPGLSFLKRHLISSCSRHGERILLIPIVQKTNKIGHWETCLLGCVLKTDTGEGCQVTRLPLSACLSLSSKTCVCIQKRTEAWSYHMWKRDGVWLPWAYEFCLMINNLRLVERRNAEGTCCGERGRRLAVEGRGHWRCVPKEGHRAGGIPWQAVRSPHRCLTRLWTLTGE